MHNYSRFLFLLVFALFACSQPSTGPEQNAAVSTGDIPAEVQAKLDTYIVQDEDALASLASTAFDESNSWSEYDVYAVTYLWGSFFPLGGGSLVWDGGTSVNAEAVMRVAAAIDFEAGEEILRDSTQPDQIQWISSTSHDLDGVSFLLLVKRGVLYFAPPELTFRTPPITFSILVDDLAHHASFHPVDHASGVAVFARQIKNAPCPHGYLAGHWTFEENTRTQGHFMGRWLARDHNAEGLLSGRFWTEPDGLRLFKGQVSGVVTDQVILEMEGTWQLTPHLTPVNCLSCRDVGYFVGRWKYLDGSGGGKLSGQFGYPDPTAATPELPFRGVWVERCDHYAGDNSWNDTSQ